MASKAAQPVTVPRSHAAVAGQGAPADLTVVPAPQGAASTIIRAKLVPPAVPAQRVPRPRVERKLAALIERHPIVVVGATAGAGKTTAVASAAAMLQRPLAWLTIDRTDAAPGRLVTYLEAALARALPDLDGVATSAMAARIPHAEAGGLLIEAAGDAPVVLVLDELDRLGDAWQSWAVIEAVVRYAPPQARIVLVSRREIPLGLAALPTLDARVGELREAELAFTVDEAEQALAQLRHNGVDARSVVQATGGWVTGVLFEAWRAREHVPGIGGEGDPLHGYLSSHILGQLDEDDRDFLMTTSLLHEVTAARAEALGVARAGERLLGLRRVRLPGTWRGGGRALRCHPRFREYLLERLERRGEDELRALRRAHGRLLAGEGHHEEAVNELMRADARDEAVGPARRAIVGVVERRDLWWPHGPWELPR
jgi:ATP/maltotriose-dependent transcriptional regulator MalT